MPTDAQRLLEQLRQEQTGVAPVSPAAAALAQLRQTAAPQQPPAITARDVVQQGAKGLMLGFSDEITAAFGAAIASVADGVPFSEAFKDILEAERADIARFEEEHPVAAPLLQIGGGLLTGGAGAGRAAALKVFRGATSRGGQIAQKVGSAAAAGVPAGAIFGAGIAEGGVGDRAVGAAEGAAIGAVGGAVLRPVIAGGVAVAKFGAKTVRGATRVLLQTEAKTANARIAQRILTDGDSTASVRRSLVELGEGATIADAAGESVKIELQRVAGMPGSRNAVINAIKNRLNGSRGRIASDSREIFTPGQLTFDETVAEITKKATDAAAPLYAKAYATVVDNTVRPLKSLLQNNRVRKAMKQAVQDIKDDTLDAADPNVEMLRKLQASADIDNPNIMVWDFTKRALDDLRGQAYTSGAKTKGNAIGRTITELRNAVDKQVPAWGEARAIWAGGKEAEAAFEAGTVVLGQIRSLKTGAMASVKMFDDLSDASKQLYRTGVGQDIENTLLTVRDDATESVVSQIAGNVAKRKVLANVIPNAAQRKQFIATLSAERDFAKNSNEILKGSRAELRRALKDADKTWWNTIASNLIAGQFALSGNQFAQLRLVSSMAGKVGRLPAGVNVRVGQKLTETRGAEIQKTLAEIDRLIRLPKSLKEAVGLSPADTVKFFLDNPQTARKFNETAAAITAVVMADKRSRE